MITDPRQYASRVLGLAFPAPRMGFVAGRSEPRAADWGARQPWVFVIMTVALVGWGLVGLALTTV